MFNFQSLLWLLLPVAALSGWYLAMRSVRKAESGSRHLFTPEYFKGLNFLLSEQPDKAIDVFVSMLEVSSDTVETHLALGNLFRKRGETERAIRIHQNLIARPALSKQQRAEGLLELGRDYMHAGLLDRAEGLFLELIEMGMHTGSALALLKDVYEQENDWENAIATAIKLSARTGMSHDVQIAHYYCELADDAIEKNELDRVGPLLKKALSYDRDCARASIIQGNTAILSGDYKAAIRLFKTVEAQNPVLIPEIIQAMARCYRIIGKQQQFLDFLKQTLNKHNGIATMVTLAELMPELEGEAETVKYFTAYLDEHPSLRGIAVLIDLNNALGVNSANDPLPALSKTVESLLDQQPAYICKRCGFSGKSLHWRCPGCKTWNSVEPVDCISNEKLFPRLADIA